MTPLVSILVPAYNHGRYVQEAVRSVLAQDYPQLELIVVDDGSKDDTWAKLLEIRPECERRFERVEMATQPNAGPCVTGNRLVSMARGEYVMLLASDDALLPGALTALVKPLEDDPKVVLAVGQNLFFDGDSRRCHWDRKQNLVYDEAAAAHRSFNEAVSDWCRIDPYGPSFGDYLTLVHGNHVPNGCLLRKAAFGGRDPYRLDAPLGDYWSMLQLAKAGKFVTVRADTFQYRWHAGNTMKAHGHMVEMTEQTLACEERLLESEGRTDLLPGFRAAREEFRRSLAAADAPQTESVGFWAAVGRFFFRIKRTERGTLVKILKIPVYRSRCK